MGDARTGDFVSRSSEADARVGGSDEKLSRVNGCNEGRKRQKHSPYKVGLNSSQGCGLGGCGGSWGQLGEKRGEPLRIEKSREEKDDRAKGGGYLMLN